MPASTTAAPLDDDNSNEQGTPSVAAVGARYVPKIPAPPVIEDKFERRKYLKGRLAAAFRIFGRLGFDDGITGHITVRDPVEPTTFWVNPIGLSFNMMYASTLIRVSETGEIIEGGKVRRLNRSAFSIHSAIHRARPDVNAAAHSHSIYGRTFCTLGRKLDITTQDACVFYNDHVVYNAYNGIASEKSEGQAIAECLGNNKAALLLNHGLLTVGETVEEAVFWHVSLEKCCHTQLLADAAAAGRGQETIKINDKDAQYSYNILGSHTAGWFQAKAMFEYNDELTGRDYLD